MTLRESEVWIIDAAENAVDSWFPRQCRNSFEDYYIWYKRGDVTIQPDKPKGYKLMTPERMSKGWTKGVAIHKIIDMMHKLPCLPKED
jgi:hypothetical protein